MTTTTHPLVEFDEQISLPPLPPINARFFVPRFVEKPQDPIMDTLRLNASNPSSDSRFRLDKIPKELSLIPGQKIGPKSPLSEEYVWQNALKLDTRGRSSEIHSWDSLRSNAPISASFGGFLSEQDGIMFAAAHYQALPRLQDAHSVVQYLTIPNLLKNMKLTVLGFSSLLYEWDPVEERFIDIGLSRGNMRKRLVIEGKDEVISSDFISRFIQIGESLRRLETLVEQLRSRSNIGPTMHAFAHALSTCLVQIRGSLASGPPSEDQLYASHSTLNSIFMYYNQHEGVLSALSRLCKRQGEGLSPKDYEAIPSSPQALLSLIHDHLHFHIESQSPHHINATLAFILTRTSTEYLKDVSRSVGFGSSERLLGDSSFSREYPTFFPKELLDALPVAQRSLKLLRVAQPDHPILKGSTRLSNIQWFWTSEDILAAVNGSEETTTEILAPIKTADQSSTIAYLPALAEFHIFDFEPGSLNGRSCFDTVYTSGPTLALDNFIKSFPSSFPPITPTLAHLTSLVLKPLLLHATALSTTLLSLFLALPPPLDIHSHLRLIRSYMLLMSPSFRRRLSAALFSDSGNFDADAESSRAFSLGSLRHGTQRADLRRKTWAVGLAPALLDRATWPPMDTDLSFFLRTVILDSYEVNANDEARRDRVEEIENRLGFAVRHISTGHTNAWANPLHVEALDFLYMEYKPPQPLDVVITPDILSKYQRIFSFLLRILRVQHALHAVLRMSTSASPYVFGTLASSRKMLLHFRFIAQSFVANLVEYVYDTAIAGNLDPFLARLEEVDSGTTHARYSDVFSLAEAHSGVMDDILTACLLRSGQRIAGGALRDSLELVLDFTVLVGDLYRGRIEEYQAASVLENLYIQFRNNMSNLFEVLSGTVEKNASLRTSLEVPHSTGVQDTHKAVGGVEALSHLLIRLDFGEFWFHANNRHR
ncbi:Spc98 family-domain-containing protein [Lentinula lateritia]|uniref:Spindle pole body component n=1 Tax=Lentinula lateritia TaxID=40482 RepID=A0ABQ8VPT4_9AGAR|nr:Spc98 family-domain-containing protein [Lentinula lateritia]